MTKTDGHLLLGLRDRDQGEVHCYICLCQYLVEEANRALGPYKNIVPTLFPGPFNPRLDELEGPHGRRPESDSPPHSPPDDHHH